MSNEVMGRSLVDLIKTASESGRPFFSVELIPGTTPALNESLQQSLRILQTYRPLFASVTWHDSHLTVADDGELHHPALKLAAQIQNQFKIDTCLHLAAGSLNKRQVSDILKRARNGGIRNVLALRGDQKPDPCSDFSHAVDLIRFVKREFGDTFALAVAGYPNGHPDAGYNQSLLYLREKVNAGADLIISQMVFCAADFVKFVDDCRNVGITAPIIPGVLVTEMTDTLERVSILTKVEIPPQIRTDLDKMRGSSTAKSDYIKNLSILTGRDLMSSEKTLGIHFFTLNRGLETVEVWNQLLAGTSNPSKSITM